ncbi:Lactam utilization protein LamB [Rhodovulum sp. PH10]|uniref:LamB/YcsF family protein n=1 Tax=Rhodovulum sp. PH10 TaxID=1187851 RepID=UPI00027C213B|nr:5-oxoprolinase subunit PxpA [Rhodovulum sp. PH10]EJW13532.1 Lactam utilization protein LamB [Rhodovulum sp. PH10]
MVFCPAPVLPAASGPRIDLNADVAEGFGAWDIGHDAELMEIVTSANVACGFHAGDPVTMQRLCRLAAAAGVAIGAHPGFNDLWGFGRRRIEMKPADIEPMVAYQIGALQAIAHGVGRPVTHVKAHGALYNMAAVDPAYATAIARAVKAVDPALVFVGLAGSALIRAGEEQGLRVAREAFADRRYQDDGTLAPRAMPGAVLTEPEAVGRQAVGIVLEGAVTSVGGRRVAVAADTLCIHGDEPTSVTVARATRAALEAAGIVVAPVVAPAPVVPALADDAPPGLDATA